MVKEFSTSETGADIYEYGSDYAKNRLRDEAYNLRDLIGYHGTWDYLMELVAEFRTASMDRAKASRTAP